MREDLFVEVTKPRPKGVEGTRAVRRGRMLQARGGQVQRPRGCACTFETARRLLWLQHREKSWRGRRSRAGLEAGRAVWAAPLGAVKAIAVGAGMGTVSEVVYSVTTPAAG